MSNEVIKYCKAFFNLIVVNGDLYTLDTETDSALPEKKCFVPFVRNLHSLELTGTFLVTFVRYDYLATFTNDIVMPFCKKIEEKYLSNEKLLLGFTLGEVT